jgi:hypothetical protein
VTRGARYQGFLWCRIAEERSQDNGGNSGGCGGGERSARAVKVGAESVGEIERKTLKGPLLWC